MTGSQRLLGEVRLYRIRVAVAESKLKALREEARQARRRRKEAKRIAQRARKQFKRSKADLAKLKQALTKAETKLFKAGGRALVRKLAKARSAAKSGAKLSKKSKAPARRAQVASPRVPRPRGRALRNEPAPKRRKTVPRSQGSGDAIEPKSSIPEPIGANSQIYEQQITGGERQEAEEQKV